MPSLLTLIPFLYVLQVTAQSCYPINSASAQDAKSFSSQTFDYIIIGGGTSGLAVASRLTDDPNISVGLLEAGIYHANDPLVNVPANGGIAIGNTSYDWSYSTIPQPGMAGREIATARGKMLGGSSGLNLMAYTVASQAEYDVYGNFASNSGPKPAVSGWNWAGLVPYFRKSEDTANQIDPFPGLPPHTNIQSSITSGTSGPVNVSIDSWYSDIIDPVVESYNNIGIKTNPDAYSGASHGVYNCRLSIDNGTGMRSYVGYYCRAATRPNFHVLTGARASKILFSNSSAGATATGVQFTVNNAQYTVKASQEVILAASTVQTPQLLELSGIGNATLLKSLGIQPLVNLPGVGENLQEHLYSILSFQLTPGHHTYDELRYNTTFAVMAAEQYAASGTGILASSDSTVSYNPFSAFLSPANITARLAMFDQVANAPGVSPLQKMQYAIQRQWLVNGTVSENEALMWSHNLYPPTGDDSYITFLSGNMHPMARGSIHINSTKITDAPVINGNYLDNAYDVQVLKDSTNLILKLAATAPLKSQIAATVTPPPLANDAALEAYVRSMSTPGSHIIGTAAMAPRNVGGVVDSSLMVYGTTNLRVVDVSTMPILVAAHLQATVWAVAEKAADIIQSSSSYK